MNKDVLRLALEALTDGDHWEKQEAITAIKQALEQEKALQALHDENERLGLYKDAYGQPEPEPFGYFRYDLRLDAWVQNRAGITGTPFYTAPPPRQPLEGVIDVQHIGYHSLQLIFRSQTDIAKFKAAHGIKGEA